MSLASIRKEKGYSQSQLAASAGISVKSLQAYEQGYRDINKATGELLFLLAKSLDTTIENILETERIK